MQGSPMTLQGLNWRYTNGTHLPSVVKEGTSDLDVYSERFTGNRDVYSATWWRVLHFTGIQSSYVGVFNCVANYNGMERMQSVTVKVSGVWMLYSCKLQ